MLGILFLSLSLLSAQPLFAQTAKKPSKLVQLSTGTIGTDAFSQIDSTGANLGAFTVPPGQVFVMTSLTVSVSDTGFVIPRETYVEIQILQNATTRLVIKVRSDELTHLVYPSGMVFGSGQALTAVKVGGTVDMRLYANGYLAPDV